MRIYKKHLRQCYGARLAVDVRLIWLLTDEFALESTASLGSENWDIIFVG